MELYRAVSIDVRNSVRKCGVVDSISRCCLTTEVLTVTSHARLATERLVSPSTAHNRDLSQSIIIDRNSTIPLFDNLIKPGVYQLEAVSLN